MVEHSIKNPTLSYARFHRLDKEFRQILRELHGDEEDYADARKAYGFASTEQHLKFKYLISVDGHTAAWLRLPMILNSNSVLLKQES